MLKAAAIKYEINPIMDAVLEQRRSSPAWCVYSGASEIGTFNNSLQSFRFGFQG
jgi:hypothetical protein